MANVIEVKVPDIGDFKNIPVIEVLVKPGDSVNREAPLVTLESDKATMEVPAPAAGRVKEIKVKVGDKVSEGSLVLLLESVGAGAAAAAQKPAAAAAPAPASQPAPSAARPQPPAREVSSASADATAPFPPLAKGGTEGEWTKPASRARMQAPRHGISRANWAWTCRA